MDLEQRLKLVEGWIVDHDYKGYEPELRSLMGSFGKERVDEKLQWSVVGQNLLSA